MRGEAKCGGCGDTVHCLTCGEITCVGCLDETRCGRCSQPTCTSCMPPIHTCPTCDTVTCAWGLHRHPRCKAAAGPPSGARASVWMGRVSTSQNRAVRTSRVVRVIGRAGPGPPTRRAADPTPARATSPRTEGRTASGAWRGLISPNGSDPKASSLSQQYATAASTLLQRAISATSSRQAAPQRPRPQALGSI